MISVRWHGRGGQGAFTAAKLLGAAYSLHGSGYALSYPSFGPERRGAPVRAFTKLDNKPILDRSEGNRFDYIVVLDDTLYDSSLLGELQSGGRLVINSKNDYEDNRIISVDAQTIAEEELKAPITNTAMLGALLGILDDVSEDEVLKAVEELMPSKIVDRNKKVVSRSAAAIRKSEDQHEA